MRPILSIILLLSCTLAFAQADKFSSIGFWSNASLVNLKEINSAEEEFSPYVWSKYLLYLGVQQRYRKKSKNDYPLFDIKLSNLEGDVLSKNILFNDDLNSSYNEGPISWDENSSTLLFTKGHVQDGNEVLDPFKRQLLQLYMAQYDTGNWSPIKRVNICTDDYNYCHPAISADGNVLIFASDKPGGQGKMDLYLSQKHAEGEWKTPINLEKINNPGNEWFPFVFGNKHLFFASDIKDGNGLDIYYQAIDDDGPVGELIRLPYPINSSSDDFGLFISNDFRQILLSSNRTGGMGKDDIYRIELSQLPALIEENKKTEAASGIAKESDPQVTETKEVISQPTPAAEKIVTERNVTLRVVDKAFGYILRDAEINFYVFDNNQAANFTSQLNDQADVSLLEAMAANTSEGMKNVTDENGQAILTLPVNKQIFIVVKRNDYDADWNFLHTRQSISSLIFELNKK